jgi:MFS family permease
MLAQSFLFNAVFFTYGLVLSTFYHITEARTGAYILPLAAGNLLGPLLLGGLFDTIGRKRMISATYRLSGLLLFAVAGRFGSGMLSAWSQTGCWIVIFFIASAAASSAYLTASEIFPLEARAMAIALFYALDTLIGGVTAPLLLTAHRHRERMGGRRWLRLGGSADGWRRRLRSCPSRGSGW